MEMCLSEQNSASGSDRSSMHARRASLHCCMHDGCDVPGNFLEAKNEVWYVDATNRHIISVRARIEYVRMQQRASDDEDQLQ